MIWLVSNVISSVKACCVGVQAGLLQLLLQLKVCHALLNARLHVCVSHLQVR